MLIYTAFMRFLVIVACVLVLYVAATSLRMVYLAHISGALIDRVSPYEQAPDAPRGRILVAGDSTAYGTGATNNRHSVAGRLGAIFPKAAIINSSQNGLRTEDLVRNPDRFIGEGPYDLIVLHIGANDILRMRSLNRETRPNLEKIIQYADERADKVAWYTSGKIGEAPFFPFYLSPILNSRSLAVRDIAIGIAGQYENVYYIDLIADGTDIFASNPSMYYSADRLHPGDAGYGLWFERLTEELGEVGL